MTEMSFLLSLQAMHGTAFDSVMMAATDAGNSGKIWIALAALLALFRRTRPVGIALFAALAADVCVSNGILKHLFARPRPCAIETGVAMLEACPATFSFPSGHTAASFTAVGVLLASREWKLAAAAVPAALLIAFSRLWLFAHFPTDVIGGAVAGLPIGAATWLFLTRIPAFRRFLARSLGQGRLSHA